MKKLISFLVCIISAVIFAESTFVNHAVIESLRKDSIMVLIADERLELEKYIISSGYAEIGQCIIIEQKEVNIPDKTKYRIIARYTVNPEFSNLIKSGNTIGLIELRVNKNANYPDKIPVIKNVFRDIIITKPDNREMLFVKEGKILIGSDDGEKDEYPKHIVQLDSFYIDKYEVSNIDYKRYIQSSGGKSPLSWQSGVFPADKADYPVLVTYNEASDFAKWAGKMLPTEEQWEKAANGINDFKIIKSKQEGLLEVVESTVYPWGNSFNHKICNSIDLWNSASKPDNLKGFPRGLLPVWFFNNENKSAYGAVNMSGNASEWTSSWYNRYEGSKYVNARFGKQVKVVKGGAWYNTYSKVRNSSRDIGGLPNLYLDNNAGFRCIKKPDIADIIQ